MDFTHLDGRGNGLVLRWTKILAGREGRVRSCGREKGSHVSQESLKCGLYLIKGHLSNSCQTSPGTVSEFHLWVRGLLVYLKLVSGKHSLLHWCYLCFFSLSQLQKFSPRKLDHQAGFQKPSFISISFKNVPSLPLKKFGWNESLLGCQRYLPNLYE